MSKASKQFGGICPKKLRQGLPQEFRRWHTNCDPKGETNTARDELTLRIREAFQQGFTMKRNLLLLSFLAFMPIYAFGDYVPGRVRASAHADLSHAQGDGRYAQVQGAETVQFKTDGKGFTKFTVSLDARPNIPFTVTAIRPNRCGQTFLATFNDNGHVSQLRIDETSPAACRQEGPAIWRLNLVTDEGAGKASHLSLSGAPEYYLLTQ